MCAFNTSLSYLPLHHTSIRLPISPYFQFQFLDFFLFKSTSLHNTLHQAGLNHQGFRHLLQCYQICLNRLLYRSVLQPCQLLYSRGNVEAWASREATPASYITTLITFSKTSHLCCFFEQLMGFCEWVSHTYYNDFFLFPFSDLNLSYFLFSFFNTFSLYKPSLECGIVVVRLLLLFHFLRLHFKLFYSHHGLDDIIVFPLFESSQAVYDVFVLGSCHIQICASVYSSTLSLNFQILFLDFISHLPLAQIIAPQAVSKLRLYLRIFPCFSTVSLHGTLNFQF